jgi:hypothetical protein
LLAATTWKIVSAVWKQFGFFRDAPIVAAMAAVDYSLVLKKVVG